MNDAQARPGAPLPPPDYTLTIDEVAELYARAGFARPIRRIQKYCARGDLECRKVETLSGEKYLITPTSVERHIALIAQTQGAARRAQPRPDAPGRALKNGSDKEEEDAAPPNAQPRPDAPPAGQAIRFLERLEDENTFLRGQIVVKDGQIKDLTERARETNVLINGLQKMLTPLLRTSERGTRTTDGDAENSTDAVHSQ